MDFCYYAGIVLDGTGNVINSGVIGRVGTSCAGQEYHEDTIELEKASGIFLKNVNAASCLGVLPLAVGTVNKRQEVRQEMSGFRK